jgi:hypothetical protein
MVTSTELVRVAVAPEPQETPIGAAFRAELRAVLDAGPFDIRAARRVERIAKAAAQSIDAITVSGLETLANDENPMNYGPNGAGTILPYGPNPETFATSAVRELVQAFSGPLASLLPAKPVVRHGPSLFELNDALRIAKETGNTALQEKIQKKLEAALEIEAAEPAPAAEVQP